MAGNGNPCKKIKNQGKTRESASYEGGEVASK